LQALSAVQRVARHGAGTVLIDASFDTFAETACKPHYAAKMGAPSIPPGRYFRMHMVGYFEDIDSERGIEWRCAGSLSLRDFLRLETSGRVPDHWWRECENGPKSSSARSPTIWTVAACAVQGVG
jgi:transposase